MNSPASTPVQDIPLDQIVPSPFQARKNFDAEQLKSLAENMKERGQITPVQVRQVGGKFELIAGERRWRAARLAGLKTLAAQVEQVDDAEAAIRGLVENLQREDLNPIERAHGYQTLANPPFNLKQEDIARQMGLKDRTQVSCYLTLLEMPGEIQDFVARATISERHCRLLRKIGDSTGMIAMARQIVKEDWSVKETEKQVNAFLGKSGTASKRPAAPGNEVSDPLPDPDPLEKVWGAIAEKTPGWPWSAEYPEADTWDFRVNLSALLAADRERGQADPRKAIEQWFLAMAGAMGAAPQIKPDAHVQNTIEGNRIAGKAIAGGDYTTLMEKIARGETPTEAEQIALAERIAAKYGRIG